MTRNASSRKDIRRLEKFSAERRQQEINFICAAMDTIPGRTFFHDLLSRCHIFSDPFTGEALVEAYSKGERNIGLSIYLDIVTHCPDNFVLMMREATIKETLDDRRSEPDDSDLDADDPAAE